MAKPQEVSDKKYVTKRDGNKQEVDPAKIKLRLQSLAEGLNLEFISLDVVVAKVFDGIYPGKILLANI